MNRATRMRSTALIGRPSMRRSRAGKDSRAAIGLLLVKGDHLAGGLGKAHLALLDIADYLAAIEDDEPVGDFVHVSQVVLDVDTRASTALHALDEGEHLAHLVHREGRRWLVEDDEIGLEVHGAGDGDSLALAAGQIVDGRVRRDPLAAKTDGVTQQLVGDRLLLLDVDEAEATDDLAAHEQVAPQRLLFTERLCLVHGLDAQVVGTAHRVARRIDSLVADPDGTGGRPQDTADDLDKRGLSGAIVADHPDDLVATDREVDLRQRLHPAKGHVHPFETHDVVECVRGVNRCGWEGMWHSSNPRRTAQYLGGRSLSR